ncbi:hypothetical protein NI17_004450 [Thermobifida halotolerans]|uniref:MORN repeat variant n=1 Tax=Thermobifida halotolerans TaxID=483545 RepID=A0AA97LYU2_9ACTN|nr:hypothetical protein [Thermobifida halotolerans]UOE20484.1 hypothetical protein NI17_004450 [Thermobifida halotolerans]
MKRVREDELEFDDDGVAFYQRELFTGEAIEFDNLGNRVGLTTYKDGYEEGISREWAPGGNLISEGVVARGGRAVGLWRRWHSNGRLAHERRFGDLGGLRSDRQWDEEGNLIKDRTYDVPH